MKEKTLRFSDEGGRKVFNQPTEKRFLSPLIEV
jgi:hypothetical protein